MIINKFNSGLSKKISPNLIALDESVVCVNLDTSVGKLAPLKQDTIYTSNISWLNKPAIYWFEGNWVKNGLGTSYATFNNILYWSQGFGALKYTDNGSDIRDLGISAPISKLSVASGKAAIVSISNSSTGSGELPEGSYSYRIVSYINDEYSYEDKTIAHDGVAGINIFVTNTNAIDKLYIGRLVGSKYYTIYETIAPTTGLAHLDQVLDISTNGTLSFISGLTKTNTRQYCYTYYSTATGHESAPSPLSVETDILGSANVSGFLPANDSIIDRVKLYRIGGNITNLTLVNTYAVPLTTITDDLTDLDIAENDLLVTKGLIPPPDGLNYLTVYNSSLFASIDSKLYFSDEALPNNWSELNTIQVQDSITGLGATQNGLLVFTRNRTYLLRGSNSLDFSIIMLNDSQGCIDHGTIKYVSNQLLWLSLDGICSSIGSNISLVSENKLGRLNVNSYGAIVYDNQYFLFTDTETYVIDFRFNSIIIFTLDSIYKGGAYSYSTDKLYLYRIDDTIVEYATSTSNRSLTYKTPWLSHNGITKVKVYKKLYLYIEGEISIDIYIDKALALDSFDLSEGFNELSLPNSFTRGYFMQIEFRGPGSVLQVEIINEEERIPYNG